jgi:hypothetical protein
MPTPDVQLTQEEDVQGEVVTSVEANSEEFKPTELSELIRNLNRATEFTQAAIPHSLPGDRAVLVGLCVQIQAIAKLFVDSAQAAMAESEEETLPLEEEDANS